MPFPSAYGDFLKILLCSVSKNGWAAASQVELGQIRLQGAEESPDVIKNVIEGTQHSHLICGFP